MKIQFDPKNNVIKLCMAGMGLEEQGKFKDDPNVTDKKFPGNLTRSYRSQEPLKIIGEETAWAKLTSEELRQWHEKLANNKGEIIN